MKKLIIALCVCRTMFSIEHIRRCINFRFLRTEFAMELQC